MRIKIILYVRRSHPRDGIRSRDTCRRQERGKYIFLEEPVEDWESIQDNNINIIEKFYENVEKYSFPFQMMAYISRLSNLRNIIKKYPESIIITERSLFTDKYVFAKMLFDSNKMNIYEYKIYNKNTAGLSTNMHRERHIQTYEKEFQPVVLLSRQGFI